MNPAAPIIIVDDDKDDKDLVNEIFGELNLDLPVLLLNRGEQLLEYLRSGKQSPFLIICDVNLPKMSGFDLREKIINDSSIKLTSIPFIFWSGTATVDQVKKAFELSSHGFFKKQNSVEELKKILKHIISYWEESETPEHMH